MNELGQLFNEFAIFSAGLGALVSIGAAMFALLREQRKRETPRLVGDKKRVIARILLWIEGLAEGVSWGGVYIPGIAITLAVVIFLFVLMVVSVDYASAFLLGAVTAVFLIGFVFKNQIHVE